MDFLPEDYQLPQSSNYMKFQDGENKLRVLNKAVTGTLYWKTVNNERKPVRLKPGVPVPINELELNPKTGEVDSPKHFWAFVVYNYKAKRIQVLELTQKSIQKGMLSFIQNKKWGDPKEYDFVVIRENDSGRVNYTVMAEPKEKLPKEIKDIFDNTNIEIEALFENKDPFLVGAEKKEEVKPEEVPF